MGKKSGTSYTSKGERPNVARKTVLAMRRERRQDRSSESVFQRQVARAAARGELRKKYDAEDSMMRVAQDLWSRYQGVVDWAACVQAAKTDWVSQFHNKYGPRLNHSKG